MANLGISGIASGVDTASIVTQLLSIDKQGQTRTKLDQSRLTAKDTGLKDLQSKLGALRAAAVALRAPAVWADRQTVESSHPTQVAVERTSGAGTGATSIRVTGLASSSQRTFTWTPDASAERTLDITSGSTSTPVTVGAGATLDDVVAAINSSTTSPVYAAAVRTDPSDPASARLVLSSRETGAGSSFTLNEGGAAVADVAGTARAGKDATYFVDGETDPALVRTSASNVVTNAIPGLQLTLKGVTAGEVSITVGSPLPDLEGAKGKVKALVEAYNAVLTLARTKTTEKVVTDPTTTADAVKGQLFGDRGLVGMVNTLRSGVSGNVSGNAPATDELGDLGISTGAIGAGRSATGTLVIDDAKLTAMLTKDPRAVQRLLGGTPGVDGIAQRMEALVAAQVGPTDGQDATGALDLRIKGLQDEQRRLADVLTRSDARIASREKRLKAQFAAMESALSASQTQQSWLTGQLNALNR